MTRQPPLIRSIVTIATLTLGCDAPDETVLTEARTLAAPTLYSAPLHESPVRADPGDLLLIPGVDFTSDAKVIYKAIGDTNQPLGHPPSVPGKPTANLGQITPIRIDDNAVTVRMPAVMTAGQAYALWVVGADGASAGIRINDARPMWLSPAAPTGLDTQSYAFMYTNADRPGLTRELKVIGRNLEPAPGQQTRVRLTSNATSVILNAANDGDPSSEIERYVARVTVPTGLTPGDYSVAVSRDGVSWVSPPQAHSFLIAYDPPASDAHSVSLFGSGPDYPCSPLDEVDDTYCITRAIHYAKQHGGDVVFPPGRWIVDANIWNHGENYSGDDTYVFTTPPGSPAPVPAPPATTYAVGYPMYTQLGLSVPSGVDLIGDTTGGTRPIIETREHFDQPFLANLAATAADPTKDPLHRIYLFGLEGHNVVQGLHFTDTYRPVYADTAALGGPAPGSRSLRVYGHFVTITDNFFEHIYTAILAYWNTLPDPGLGHNVMGSLGLIVTDNTFATHENPLLAPVLQDSLIRGNTFWPGATHSPIAIGTTGSRHVEISDNTIDGSETAYSGDALGWRAGMFFAHTASHEHLLVSDNDVICTGTRTYEDGEAIGTDSNLDRFGFRSGQTVTASTPSSVSVLPAPGDTLLSVAADEFDGRWVRVDHGPGLGQTRKIVDATQDGAGGVHFTVSPPFDVAPVAGESRIIVSQQTWQMYLVDNTVDNQCSQGLSDYDDLHWNGGTLGFYGSAADSVIDSNEQQHTAGILVASQYVADDSHTQASYQTSQYFIEVRGNSIVGSFGDTGGQPNVQNRTGSGILLLGQIVHYDVNHAIVPTDDHLGFGVSVSHNLLQGAALTEPNSSNHVWAIGVATGGAPEGEALMPAYDDTLIFKNQVSNVPAPWYPVPGWLMWPAGDSLSISNGQWIPTNVGFGHDYPHNTTVCDNVLQTGAGIGDFPGSLTSSLIVCP